MSTSDGPSPAQRPGPRGRFRAVARTTLAVLFVVLLIWAAMFFRVLVLLPSAAKDDATIGLQAALADLPPLA
ncbi:hypothetical protein M3F59_13990 [Brachybacterium muris]|uniref:hypothetical protein n=1 Tax=Brachybacterium muris TaxID=219301 RepID=UPI00223A8E8B|nr:hypothetical protein [Brachybacterium muris]MCT2262711.1 hypothetical protein [Brachybacterium muris]